jgi:hypothetical protein
MSLRGGITLVLNASTDDGAKEEKEKKEKREKVQHWLVDYRTLRPPPEPGVFELGICMAGAISAGAYTAGVLDLLIEALDAFAKEKARRGAGKWLHEVRVPVLGGASAGGMCAAIAAIFLDRNFPAVHNGTSDAEQRRNPFWRAWVEEMDIKKLLGKNDQISGKPLPSLLDGTALEGILERLVDARADMAPAERPWLVTPLRALLTLTDLKGVPYGLRFDGPNRHWMSLHADYVRYVIELDKATNATKCEGDEPKVGETVLNLTALRQPDSRESEDFKAAALGTGAFPFVFPARILSRDPANYLFRAGITAIPLADLENMESVPDPLPAWMDMLCPEWEDDDEPDPSPYNAYWVDGGVMNNEPVDLVRRVLVDWGRNSNKRVLSKDTNDTSHAVLLIDPFVKRESRDVSTGLLGVLPLLKRALLGNSRFKLEELALAGDRNIGSRFMISPARGRKWKGEQAIAGGYMSGFLGFFHRAYREHDYRLGRRNAQHFLRKHFVLPEDNPLFANWTEKDKADWAVKNVTYPDRLLRLPVIPLCGDLSREEELPDWPKKVFEAKQVRSAIAARIDVVLPALRDELRDWLVDKLSLKWRNSTRLSLALKLFPLALKLFPQDVLVNLMVDIVQKEVNQVNEAEEKRGKPFDGNDGNCNDCENEKS